MSCSPFDLKDYFLQELSPPEHREVESHVKTCAPCREELDRLQATGAALWTLRDEEIPQRIAFVSDKILEPSHARRIWDAFWNNSARLAFAGAAVLALAVLLRPAQKVVVQAPAPAPVAAVQTVSEADVQARIDLAVKQAVAQVELRNEAKTRAVMAELESARQRLVIAASEFDISQKRVNEYRRVAFAMPPAGDRQ